MKKLLLLIGFLVGGFSIANAASVLFPYQGGTGTSTAPTLGQVLVGTSAGIYAPQATSTLGFGGSGTVTSITAGTGLTGGTITGSGTIALNLAAQNTWTASTTFATTTISHLIAGNNSSAVSSNDATMDIYGTTNAIIHAHNLGAQGATAGAAYIGYAVPLGAAITSGSRLAAYVFGGSNDPSNTLANSAAITAFASENWTTASSGSKMAFEVTPNGSTSRITPMVITNNGRIGMGTAPDESAILDVHQVGNSVPMIQAQDGGSASATSGGIFQASIDNGSFPASGTRIGGYQFSVDGGSGTKQVVASINAVTTEQTATTTLGSSLRFTTTTNGASAPAVRMTIDNTGNIGIASSTPTNKLTLGSGSILVPENTLATSTSMTIDWTAGNQQLLKISTSSVAITFSNPISGQNLKMIVCNPPTGTAGALSFSTSTFPVYWVNKTLPTQTTTANNCDVWSFLATNASSSALTIFGTMSPNF